MNKQQRDEQRARRDKFIIDHPELDGNDHGRARAMKAAGIYSKNTSVTDIECSLVASRREKKVRRMKKI